MLENRPIDQYKWGYLTDFQVRLNRPEEKFRDVPNSSEKIDAMLEEIGLFYGARRAVILEVDWELNLGLFIDEYCRDVENQNLNLTCIPFISLPKWYNRLRLRQPVISSKQRFDRSNTEYSNIICLVQ